VPPFGLSPIVSQSSIVSQSHHPAAPGRFKINAFAAGSGFFPHPLKAIAYSPAIPNFVPCKRETTEFSTRCVQDLARRVTPAEPVRASNSRNERRLAPTWMNDNGGMRALFRQPEQPAGPLGSDDLHSWHSAAWPHRHSLRQRWMS
jgi:hypothetical protein